MAPVQERKPLRAQETGSSSLVPLQARVGWGQSRGAGPWQTRTSAKDSLSTEAGLAAVVRARAPSDREGVMDRTTPEATLHQQARALGSGSSTGSWAHAHSSHQTPPDEEEFHRESSVKNWRSQLSLCLDQGSGYGQGGGSV